MFWGLREFILVDSSSPENMKAVPVSKLFHRIEGESFIG